MSARTAPDFRTRDVTLLLGAEGCAELSGQPWFRAATPEEIQAHKVECDRDDYDALYSHDGRPYFAVVVTREAPLELWLEASSYLRLVRLSDRAAAR